MDKKPNTQQWAYQSYKRPFVRDLAYAISCPTVLNYWYSPQNPLNIQVHSSSFWQQQYVAYTPRLQQLDACSQTYQTLVDWLQSRPSPNRLGFHFEGLMLFWLMDGYTHQCHFFELLNHNVQIFSGNLTLGEVDCIIHNHTTNEVEHWELAIKFYLGSPPYHPENWVGLSSAITKSTPSPKATKLNSKPRLKPNSELSSNRHSTNNNNLKPSSKKDTLAKKMQHMQSQAFCHHQICDDEGNAYNIHKRVAVIKGRFFVQDPANFSPPNWLNPQFPIHLWLTQRQLQQMDTPQALRRADYIEWFTPRLPNFTQQFIDSHTTFTQPPFRDTQRLSLTANPPNSTNLAFNFVVITNSHHADACSNQSISTLSTGLYFYP